MSGISVRGAIMAAAPLAAASFLAVLLGAPLATPAAAQTVTKKCESKGNRLARCKIGNVTNVRITRQLSKSPCFRGSSWGHDANGIWVNNGCRAIFAADKVTASTGGSGGSAGSANKGGRIVSRSGKNKIIVECISVNQQPNICGFKGATKVSVHSPISGTSCVRGRNWNYNSKGLWVSAGCGAQFALTRGTATGGTSGSTGTGTVSSGGPAKVTCRSFKGTWKFCAANVNKTVVLKNQISNRSCRRGLTWGFVTDGIWTADGCSAQFDVQ